LASIVKPSHPANQNALAGKCGAARRRKARLRFPDYPKDVQDPYE